MSRYISPEMQVSLELVNTIHASSQVSIAL